MFRMNLRRPLYNFLSCSFPAPIYSTNTTNSQHPDADHSLLGCHHEPSATTPTQALARRRVSPGEGGVPIAVASEPWLYAGREMSVAWMHLTDGTDKPPSCKPAHYFSFLFVVGSKTKFSPPIPSPPQKKRKKMESEQEYIKIGSDFSPPLSCHANPIHFLRSE